MSTSDILEIEHVSKTFPGQRALDDVSFTVRASEVHGLVGQNGSGKSTLVKVLAGYHKPDTGSIVRVAGAELAFEDPAATRSAGIRTVHQDLGLVATLDTVDNLALGRGYATKAGWRIPWAEARRSARAALSDLGYEFDVSRPVSELAASERTGVAIVRALRGASEEARVLILDEATASLPAPDVRRLFEVIRRVAEQGLAVIYVSHHLDEVFEVAQRVTVLRDARLVATREVASLDHDELVELIVGRSVQAGRTSAGATAAGDPALAITALSGRIIDGMDLQVQAGEVIGIAGLTGSGREEIAGMLFGGLSRRGRVEVHGIELEAARPDLAVKLGMGFVPADRQAHAVISSFNVRENASIANLASHKTRRGLRTASERASARDWVERLSVRPGNAEALITSLSGGNQQKVILARWLQREPRVLILDEPTQGVDVGAKEEIHRLVDGVGEQGAAVVVCSSSAEELERLAHRVIVLRRGVVAAELRGTEVQASRIDELSLQAYSQEAAA